MSSKSQKSDKPENTPPKKKGHVRKLLRHAGRGLAHLAALLVVFAILGALALVLAVGTPGGRQALIKSVVTPVLATNGVVLDYKNLDTPDARHWHMTNVSIGIPEAHITLAIADADIALDYHALLLGRLGMPSIALKGLSSGNVPAALTAKTAFTAAGVVDMLAHGTDMKISAADVPLELVAVLGGFALPEGLAAQLNGDVSVQDETVTIDRLTLAMRDTRPQISFNGKKQSGDIGVLRASGTYGPQGFDMALTTDKLSTALLQMMGVGLSSGTITTDISLKGTPEHPQLAGNFAYDERAHKNKKRPSIRLLGKLATQNDVLTANIALSQSGGKSGGNLTLSVPLDKYMTYFASGKGVMPLAGNFGGNLDLSFLRFILDPFQHKLSGNLLVDLRASGDIDHPAINGSVRLEKTNYENIISGTTLTNVDVVLAARGQSVSIEKATAGDGATGKISLAGNVDWSSGVLLRTPFRLTLTADHAQLLRRRDMSGTATGTLTLAGTLKGMTLDGTLDVSPFNMSLDSLMTSSIPEIDVTDVTPGQTADAAATPKDMMSALPPIILNVTVKVAQQAYLRGMGVDAEIGGHVSVKGPLPNSDYSGSFKVIRGTCDVFGKKFVLQQGQVDFQGDAMYLNISGLHHEKDIDTTATLSGSLKKIALTLTSVPAMPQDEILSNLLFGKSASSISPFQAVRLAAAVQQMRGGGTGIFDPVGTVRDTLGLDSLSVGSDTSTDGQQGLSVGAGKYISDKVYLEVQKTPDPTHPFEADVQVELTPHLNLKSGSGGPTGAGNIGLQWKKDY